MTTFASIGQEIRFELPSCPEQLIESAVRSAAINLCEKGCIWRVQQRVASLPGNLREVSLTLPDGARLAMMLSVRLGSHPLAPISRAQLDQSHADWEQMSGTPTVYCSQTNSTVRLVPQTSAPVDTPLIMRYAVAPLISSTSMPDEIAERWHFALQAGARADLFRRRAQWADPTAAADALAQFNQSIGRARVELHNELQNSRMHVAIPRI